MATQRFSVALQQWVKITKIKLDTVIRKVSLDCFRAVIIRSPVDTGRFRASWRVSLNTVDLAVHAPVVERVTEAQSIAPGEPPTADEMAYANGTILKAKISDTVLITNNLPYAIPLEHGHSKHARPGPTAILGYSVSRIKANIEADIRRIAGQSNPGTGGV